MKYKPHSSRDFNSMTREKTFEVANTNRIGIREHPKEFDYLKTPKPPLTDAEYGAIIDDAIQKDLIHKQGGRAQQPDADKSFELLLFEMEENAVYVDCIALGNEGIIIKSGFNVANGSGPNHKQTFPGTPTVLAVRADASGEIDTDCEVYGTGAVYSCIVSENGPLIGVTMSNQGQLIISAENTNRIIHVVDVHRKKKITGLTPGVFYWIYYYVSNSAGVSQLSVGVKILCG